MSVRNAQKTTFRVNRSSRADFGNLGLKCRQIRVFNGTLRPGANECGGRPLLHEHEVAVQTATQPGNCSASPPPGTYRSGAREHCLFRFQVIVYVRFHVCLRLSWTSTLLAVGITPTTTAGFSKGSPRFTDGIYREACLFLTVPPSRRGATELTIKPCPLAARTCCTFRPTTFSSFCYLPAVQFSYSLVVFVFLFII